MQLDFSYFIRFILIVDQLHCRRLESRVVLAETADVTAADMVNNAGQVSSNPPSEVRDSAEAFASCTRCTTFHSLSVAPPLCPESPTATAAGASAAENTVTCSSEAASGGVHCSSSFCWQPSTSSSGCGSGSGSSALPSACATPSGAVRAPVGELTLPHSASFPLPPPASTHNQCHTTLSADFSAPVAATAGDPALHSPSGCTCLCHRSKHASESSDSGAHQKPAHPHALAHAHAHAAHNAHRDTKHSTEQNLSASFSSSWASRKVLFLACVVVCMCRCGRSRGRNL